MKVACVAALALAVRLAPTPAAAQSATGTSLELGKPVTGTLARGEVQRHPIDLAAGSYLRLAVQSRGIGVVATLLAPDGTALTYVDVGREQREEQALVIAAPAAGAYRVEVRPLEKNPSPGGYEVRVDDLRPSRPAEQRLVEAQALFLEGGRARKTGTAASLATAVEANQKALEIWRQGGERWWQAQALFQLAELHGMVGQFKPSLEDVRELILVGEALGCERLKGRALNLRGDAQRALGDPTALDSYLESEALWDRFDDAEAEAETVSSLGTVYSERGDKQRAIESYTRGLALMRALGNTSGEATTLGNIGVFYHDLSEYRRACEYYEQALSLARAIGDRRLQGAVLAALGQAYVSLGEPQKALAPALEAIAASSEAGDRRWEGGAYDRAGRAYDAVGQGDKAVDHFRRAIEIYRDIPDPQGEGDAVRSLGRHEMAAGRAKEALELYRQSLTIAQRIGDRQRTIRMLNAVAVAERAVGDDVAARRHGEASLALMESVRASLPDHRLRGSLLAGLQSYYDFQIDLLLQMHRRPRDPALVVEALETSERSRARTFLELVNEAGNDVRAGVDPALLERDHALERKLTEVAERQVRVLVGPASPEQAESLAKEIQDITREHDLLEAEIRASTPESAVLQPQPLRLSEIQSQVLDEHTMLLEYHLGKERSYLWAVTREAVQVHELPKAADIEAMARRWHDAMSAGPNAGASPADEARKQAAALSATLIAPVAGLLGDRRLLVVAGDALQYVSFAALPLPGRPDRPLVVDHEVVSAPSASFLAVLRRHQAGRAKPSRTLAVLADPVFDAGDERITAGPHRATTADRSPAREGLTRDITRAAHDVGLPDGAISRLPFTRREAKAILSLVPPAQRMEALDFSASRDTAISSELAQYRYLHFATHGFADSAHPELSGIVLSLVDRKGQAQRGFLPAADVFNLKLPADLVVLSGCRTALGKEIRGEGLQGLTRAFMSAGAGRVVASLWKVDDAATAELMKTMYERMLRDGQPPARALRSAQIAMSQSRRWSAPYFWAAFVIQGEWN